MRIQASYELITVMAHHFVASEIRDRAPRVGKNNRRVQDQKYNGDNRKEFQNPLLPQTPPRRPNALKRVIVSERDRKHLRKIF